MFDFITGFISSIGALGVGILMFLENVFPPIPSELIMPLAGYNAASGEMSFVAVVLLGTLGSLAGALLWYWIGAAVGRTRLKKLASKHGRWLTIAPEDIDSAERWFQRHGGAAVFIGRLIPTVRTFISVPAGITHMPLWRFTLYSALGSLIWTAFLAALGLWLGSAYKNVSDWLNPISTVIVVGIVGYYLYRVVTYKPRDTSSDSGDES